MMVKITAINSRKNCSLNIIPPHTGSMGLENKLYISIIAWQTHLKWKLDKFESGTKQNFPESLPSWFLFRSGSVFTPDWKHPLLFVLFIQKSFIQIVKVWPSQSISFCGNPFNFSLYEMINNKIKSGYQYDKVILTTVAVGMHFVASMGSYCRSCLCAGMQH